MPAAIALEPALAVIDTISAGEYAKVHWMAAGLLPAGEVRVRPSVALPSAAAVPDEMVSAVCASRGAASVKRAIAANWRTDLVL